MTSKELRIGNYIKCYHGIVQVVEITKTGIISTPNLIGSTNDQLISGIPLTEDWLLKFGFEKVKDIDAFVIWSFPDINFTFETDRNFVMLDSHIIANTKYVHQMQNLFFALTGQELTETA